MVPFEKTLRIMASTSRRKGFKTCQFIVNYGTNGILIIFYYFCSIGLTFYQKHLFTEFKFPLTVVVVHLCVKFIISGICRLSSDMVYKKRRVVIHWSIYFKNLFPPGAAAGIDIGLSQWSLEFITITLYTMTKSTALLFILLFAVLLRLEEMKWSLVILVSFIAGGLSLFTYKYTQFNSFGFILVMIASVLSGLRWTLSQLVLQKEELCLTNPIDMVYHIQPWMIISLLPLTVFMEGKSLATSSYGFCFHDINLAGWMWCRILFGAGLAFLMEVSEYLLVSYTSSLTLSIAGVAKEILTLSLAIQFSDENLSLINLLGLVMCVIGITLHVVIKASSKAAQSPNRNSPNDNNSALVLTPLLETDPSSLEFTDNCSSIR